MELHQSLQQKQNISQKMIQSMQVLQMSTLELNHHIKELIMENPLVEWDEEVSEKPEGTGKDEKLLQQLEWLRSSDWQNRVYYIQEEQNSSMEPRQADMGENLEEYLMAQLMPYCEKERDSQIYEYMINFLDSRGYMDEEPGEIQKHFGLTKEEYAVYLSRLQSCDPAGIGARSLSECLLLQLKRYEEDTSAAEKIAEQYLWQVGKGRLEQIAAETGYSLQEVKRAVSQIKGLNPKPSNGFSDRSHLKYIVPDVFVIRFEGYYEVLLNDAELPRIKLNADYIKMMKEGRDR